MSDERDDAAPDRSAPFRAMAERIALNRAEGFGGAVVIVPAEGDPMEILFLDPKQDLAMFWSNIQTRCQIAISEIETLQRQNAAYGRR